MEKTMFSKISKQLRESHNLSMQELADAIGTTKSTVNMWENGNAIPRQETLKKLSSYYGVSIDELLGNNYKENKIPDIPLMTPTPKAKKMLETIEKMADEEIDQLMRVTMALYGKDIFEDDEEISFDENGNIVFKDDDEEKTR